MANAQVLSPMSVEAGSAITIYRYLAVAADKQADHAANAARVDGVAAESQATVGGAVGLFPPDGRIIKVEAGAAVSAGASLQSNGSGQAITAVSGIGNFTTGIAVDAAAGAGEVIRSLFLVDRDQA